MSHYCGFDFESPNQPWATCSCGAIRTNPYFQVAFAGGNVHWHIGNIKGEHAPIMSEGIAKID